METLEDIIEAFPEFLTDEPVNGGDLVEFVGDMITRYEANRPRPRPIGIGEDLPETEACNEWAGTFEGVDACRYCGQPKAAHTIGEDRPEVEASDIAIIATRPRRESDS